MRAQALTIQADIRDVAFSFKRKSVSNHFSLLSPN